MTAVLWGASSSQLVPWPSNPAAPPIVPYRIYRSPVKSAATPLQLPASTVIDLDASGIDAAATFGNGADVAILFTPSGSVYGVYYVGGTNTLTPITQPIFLLVGKRERVGAGLLLGSAVVATDQAAWPNWATLGNVWLVINPQTGLVSSGDNGAIDMSNPAWTNPANWQGVPGPINTARTLARDSQGLGGR